MGILKLLFSNRPKKTPIVRVNKKVLLAGNIYSIKLESASRNYCKKSENTLIFGLKEMTRENFENYFESWYRREARKLFKTSITKWREVMSRMGYEVDEPKVKIYRMRRAWGRCYYTKNTITLNLHLAKTPVDCIDYIALHELCHFLINSHSNEFYAIMSRIDPKWRSKEVLLKDFSANYKVI